MITVQLSVEQAGLLITAVDAEIAKRFFSTEVLGPTPSLDPYNLSTQGPPDHV